MYPLKYVFLSNLRISTLKRNASGALNRYFSLLRDRFVIVSIHSVIFFIEWRRKDIEIGNWLPMPGKFLIISVFSRQLRKLEMRSQKFRTLTSCRKKTKNIFYLSLCSHTLSQISSNTYAEAKRNYHREFHKSTWNWHWIIEEYYR